MNGRTLEDDKQLSEVFESFEGRKPFFAELVGKNGFNLLIGIGTEGCVQCSSEDGNPPYLMARIEKPELDSAEYLEFLMGGTPTPVSAKYILPFDVVRDIAMHFRRTGARTPTVTWEEI